MPKEARPICEVWDELGPQVPNHYKEDLEGWGRPARPTDDDAQAKERKKFSDLLQEAEVIDTLNESQCVRHVAQSSPISVGTAQTLHRGLDRAPWREGRLGGL